MKLLTIELLSLDLSWKSAWKWRLNFEKFCATSFRQNSMKLKSKPWSTVDLSVRKVSASKSIDKYRKWVSNLSLSSETDVTDNLTTFELVWRVQKSGMDTRNGLGTERRLEGRLEAQTGRKWATLTSRRESCLSFSVLSSILRRWASQGQGSLQQYKSAKSNNQL